MLVFFAYYGVAARICGARVLLYTLLLYARAPCPTQKILRNLAISSLRITALLLAYAVLEYFCILSRERRGTTAGGAFSKADARTAESCRNRWKRHVRGRPLVWWRRWRRGAPVQRPRGPRGRPRRTVCYASFSLLRPFTLHYAPFSRTAEAEEA